MSFWETFVFAVHLYATFYMTGLIWFVQKVHYPLMAVVSEDQFVEYENRHTRLTGPVVAPVMIAEMVTGLMLLWVAPFGGAYYRLLIVAVVLMILAWLVTFGLSVPLHKKLCDKKDIRTLKRLVSTNWLRTLAWTGRAGIVFYLLLEWR